MTRRGRLVDLWNGVVRIILRARGKIGGGHPVAVDQVAMIRRLGIGEDALITASRPVSAEQAIGGPLGALLKGRDLGTWALGPRSLRFIAARILELRPQIAIEFGSGISTAVLAAAMRDAADGPTLLVSFEQDEAQAADIRHLLDTAGLGDRVEIVIAPLVSQEIEGIVTTCYGMPDDVGKFFANAPADLVIVDGPAAESGARFGTLPLARPFVGPRAVFILDDAMRDGELAVGKLWSSLAYVQVDGIHLIERGLLTGMLQGGHQA